LNGSRNIEKAVEKSGVKDLLPLVEQKLVHRWATVG
jgi:hypothetical protein